MHALAESTHDSQKETERSIATRASESMICQEIQSSDPQRQSK
jgi:hypothetical protein